MRAGRSEELKMKNSLGCVSKNCNKDADVKISLGAIVKIFGGPLEADKLSWWKVSWNGYEEWIADHTGNGKTILIFSK